ncbi:GTP-binding protein [Pedobacter steynii]
MKLYLIGGFLGSGKTTAILNACVELIRHKVNVGVITNDQGAQLVDTKFIKYANVSVKEVTDGCFCCNYNKLDELIENLKQKDNTEVIFAESVGSCTDMIATVVKPLQEFRTDIETIISVFVDVNVLPNILQGAALFVDSVNYIYKKQIQEADILVINKIDTLSNTELEKMKVLVASKYPEKTVLFQNSLDEASINEWLTTLTGTKVTSRKSLDIDYDVYGAGEAELAWLDLEIELFSDDNNAFGGATALVSAIHSAIIDDKLSVGHLKFLLTMACNKRK